MSSALYLGSSKAPFPEWVIFHLPHHSTYIPSWCRSHLLLNDSALKEEILRMTDSFTHDIYAESVSASNVVVAPVSRLIVDTERFAFDDEEGMANVGQGVIYQQSSFNTPLRRTLSWAERRYILEHYYYPHHEALGNIVRQYIRRYGRALIIDGHSFSDTPLPLEPDQSINRPDICIGCDAFHTPDGLAEELKIQFLKSGFSVKKNTPFSGTMVPMEFYQNDARVMSIMVEINRHLYMFPTGEKRENFNNFACLIRTLISRALSIFHAKRLAARKTA